MGGRKLPGRPKNPPSAPSAKDTTSRNRDDGSTGTPSLLNRGAGLSSKIGNVGEERDTRKRASSTLSDSIPHQRNSRGIHYEQYNKKRKGGDYNSMQLNSNGSNQAESVEVFPSSSNDGRATQNSSGFVGRATQNSSYEGAASNSNSAESRHINRMGMNVNRASTTTNYVMVPKTSVANISEVDDNLSSVGNFSAGTTWRLMTESGKMDDDAIKLTLASYIKQKIFPHLKFIPGPSWVDFSTKEHSLCGKILKHLNVPVSFHDKFWKKYGRKVDAYLGSKRNDTATALKSAFFSKYKL